MNFTLSSKVKEITAYDAEQLSRSNVEHLSIAVSGEINLHLPTFLANFKGKKLSFQHDGFNSYTVSDTDIIEIAKWRGHTLKVRAILQKHPISNRAIRALSKFSGHTLELILEEISPRNLGILASNFRGHTLHMNIRFNVYLPRLAYFGGHTLKTKKGPRITDEEFRYFVENFKGHTLDLSSSDFSSNNIEALSKFRRGQHLILKNSRLSTQDAKTLIKNFKGHTLDLSGNDLRGGVYQYASRFFKGRNIFLGDDEDGDEYLGAPRSRYDKKVKEAFQGGTTIADDLINYIIAPFLDY